MCIDIDTGNYTDFDDGLLEYYIKKKIKEVSDDSYHEHNLTMLDSFHISLGKPKKEVEVEKINTGFRTNNITTIIGEITLAPIYISEKDGKKSAWIALSFRHIISAHTQMHHWTQLNLGDFGRFGPDSNLYRRDGTPFYRFHVSLANLTGKRRDSISRPEDCIIDTITN